MSHCESGDPVEGQFIRSWDVITEFFDWMAAFSWKDQIFQFIAQLRRAGYDRTLRAGQSLDMFVVSRSLRHGLRPDQPCVVFCFHDGVMDVLERKDKCVKEANISLSPAVEAVLSRLLNHPID